VTIGPQDRNVPGAQVPGGHFPGALRASDADRERVIDTLKTAYVQGRLTEDELDLYTGRALEGRTYAELAAVTVTIPAWRPEPRPPAKPARARTRKPVKKKLIAGGAAAIAMALSAAIWAAFLTYDGGFIVMFVFVLVGFTLSSGPWPSHRRHPGTTRAAIRRQVTQPH
jgi:hypothetical protein